MVINPDPSNPYASPQSDVRAAVHTDVQKSSIWSLKGRLSVFSYFGQSLILTLVNYTAQALIVLGGMVLLGSNAGFIDQMLNPDLMNPVLLIPTGILSLVFIWISLCMAVKRFHDLNLSGWWVLTFIILIGLIAMVIPGKDEPNRFGGWRKTRPWETVCAVLSFILLAAILVSGFLVGFGKSPLGLLTF